LTGLIRILEPLVNPFHPFHPILAGPGWTLPVSWLSPEVQEGLEDRIEWINELTELVRRRELASGEEGDRRNRPPSTCDY